MTFQDLSIEIDDGVAMVTLDRPESRNVISDEPMVRELPAACEQLGRDSEVRAVVLTGRGTAFSAGGNVRLMHEKAGMFGGQPHEIAEEYRRGIQRLILSVFHLPVPTIAAINGPAIGAGFDLALACDLRLASSTARFGETFVNLGLVPGDGGSWLLPRAVGHQRAAELAFTGRVIGADEALALGVVLEVHEPEVLLDAARALAGTIASKPPTAMRMAKELLHHSTLSFEEVLDKTAPLQAILHGTPEHEASVEELLVSQARRSEENK